MLARKLKLLKFSRNWEIRLVFNKVATMFGDKKNFFGATRRTLENDTLGMKYFTA